GVGADVLQERTQAVIDEGRKRAEIGGGATTFRAGVPQVYLNIDRVKAERMGVLLSDVFGTLQANLGSVYVNDFNKFDRTYQVRAAQYESWALPLAVILGVPLGLLGVVAAVNIRGLDNNVYTQIGVVLIIALASKNAILIVEFARELRLQGRPIREAAVEASR